MPKNPKLPIEFREMPGPHSWAKAAAGALIGISGLIGFKIADQTGLIVGIVIGAAVSIGIVLYWVSRPK